MNSGKTNILDSLSSISNSAFRNQCLPNSEGEFPTTFGSSLSVQRKSVSSIGLINTPEFAVNQNHSVGDLDSNNEIENTTAPQQDTCHSENENILCVVWANGSLGGAFYSTSNAVLQCLEDCMESTSFYFTEKLLSSMNPHVILTCSRQDSIFINFIAKHTGGDSENSNIIGTSHSETHEFHRGVVLEELPLSDFNYVAGRNKILNLKIPGMPENATQIDKAIYISGLIPLDKELMIKCAGALLMYLEKIQVNVQREQQSHSVSVIELKLISLTDYLTINDDTLKALYVFRKEVHPSVYKSFGYGKEGLSLFGIFNKTKSSIGSTLFRSWMNNPLKNFNEIQERLVCIEFLSKIKNTEVLKLLQLSIRKAKNLQPKFAKMLKSVATLQDWQSIVKTCSICLDIKNICDKLPANISIFHKFQTKFIPNAFQQILKLIERFIDFNASSLHGRFIIKKDIDSILDKRAECSPRQIQCSTQGVNDVQYADKGKIYTKQDENTPPQSAIAAVLLSADSTITSCGIAAECKTDEMVIRISSAAVWDQTQSQLQIGTSGASGCIASFNAASSSYELTSGLKDCDIGMTITAGDTATFTATVTRTTDSHYQENNGVAVTREKSFTASVVCNYAANGVVSSQFYPTSAAGLSTDQIGTATFTLDFYDSTYNTIESSPTVEVDEFLYLKAGLTNLGDTGAIRVQIHSCTADLSSPTGNLYTLASDMCANEDDTVVFENNGAVKFKSFRFVSDSNFDQTIKVTCEVAVCSTSDTSSALCNCLPPTRKRRAAEYLGAISRSTDAKVTQTYIVKPKNTYWRNLVPTYVMFTVGGVLSVIAIALAAISFKRRPVYKVLES